MSINCPRCGSEIDKKGKFCPRCGEALDPKAVREVPATYNPPYLERPKQTFSTIAFGLAIGGLVFWFLVIPSFVLGIIALKREPAGKGYATAAVWISSVILGIWVLIILAAVIIPLVLVNYYA